MYRWCSNCNERRNEGDSVCPVCRDRTDIELDINDTLRIDDKREFIIIKQLSHFTDAGMSAVYLAARKDKPNMYGAIKITKPSKIEALTREAEVLQKLKHNHIIRLVHPERALWQDRKDNTTLHFFALEYMDGGSLKDLLKQKQKLSLNEAVPIILAVGQGLAHAHENGYVHLDVKPANVLFGADGRIVLSDFGIARAEIQASALKKRLGTLFYNSPEQLLNPPTHTLKADIYALGIMLYEMLVGTDRFRQHRSTSSSKEDSHASAGANSPSQSAGQLNYLPPPRKLESRIPRAVERVILKAIAPNPAGRYDSVPAMLDDLMKATAEPPPQKKLLLLLASVGILLAIVMIGLGIFFFLDRPPIVVDTPSIAATSTATSTPVETTPSVILVSTSTPTFSPTPPPTNTPPATRPPTVTPLPPTDTPTPTPRPRVTATQTVGPTLDGSIELIAPEEGIQLPDVVVEFRWRWRENKGCDQPPEGYAFEIGIWLDDNAVPRLGAMDAKAEKLNIKCDPATGIRSFTIGNIKDAPGLQVVKEGRFRWDVALVQLDPYRTVITTQYRTFFIN